MAKLVTKFKYLKPGDRSGAGKYVKYIATREGVEKIDDTKRLLPATKKQQELIKQIIVDFPEAKEMLEYEDYKEKPTIGNASDFISRALEENSDEMSERKTYADYIATRPGAERFGTHGLFTTDGVRVDLEKVSDELNHHEGNVWTVIISLRRPDAERLGFNIGSRWRDMLRTQEEALSRELNIPITNLRWFAAYHNESHHPHVHLIAYSTRKNEGYLTPKGVKHLRSSFAKDIFMQDNLSLYEQQTQYRDELRTSSRELIEGIVKQMNAGTFHNPVLEEKIRTLAIRLSKTSGKKVYGYLKADVKALVNSIVDELEKDERISSLYNLWYEQKENVIRTYTEEVPERLPLSKNPEFKAIRNAVIREAVNLSENVALTEAGNVGVAEEEEESDPRIRPREPWGEDEPEDTGEDQTDAEPEERSSSFWGGNRRRDPWWSERYKEARAYLYGNAWVEADVGRAIALLLEEAEAGNGYAMYDLGRLELLGGQKEPDEESAQEWFGRAYHKFIRKEKTMEKPGYLRYRIGKMHALGYGVEQSYEEAAKWYQKAVDEDNPFAGYALGSLYRRGRGVCRDSEKAYELFRMAAEDKDAPNAYAAYELGKMCEAGVGTEMDELKSRAWYRQAFHGFKRIAAGMPDEKLFYRLGQMCLNGIGTEVNYREAEMYFIKSAESGHTQAMYSLGKLLLMEEYEGYDPKEAVLNLTKAAERDHDYAKYKLGCLYFFGKAVERDEHKGIQYLTLAAEQGNEYAIQFLEQIRENAKWAAMTSAVSLFFSAARIVQNRIVDYRKLRPGREKIEQKLRSRIEEKRQAHGIKHG